MNHKQKVKLAHRMRTPQEEKDKVPIFGTAVWIRRSEGIAKGIAKRIKEIQMLREAKEFDKSLA